MPFTSCRLPVAFAGLFILLIGCGKPLPNLDGVNLTDWKNDKNGCSGTRQRMADNFVAQKDKLLALSETDIIKLLGKPDQNELYKRNTKFYTYYFQQGPGCAADSIATKSITFRFNAMGLAKEIVIE